MASISSPKNRAPALRPLAQKMPTTAAPVKPPMSVKPPVPTTAAPVKPPMAMFSPGMQRPMPDMGRPMPDINLAMPMPPQMGQMANPYQPQFQQAMLNQQMQSDQMAQAALSQVPAYGQMQSLQAQLQGRQPNPQEMQQLQMYQQQIQSDPGFQKMQQQQQKMGQQFQQNYGSQIAQFQQQQPLQGMGQPQQAGQNPYADAAQQANLRIQQMLSGGSQGMGQPQQAGQNPYAVPGQQANLLQGNAAMQAMPKPSYGGQPGQSTQATFPPSSVPMGQGIDLFSQQRNMSNPQGIGGLPGAPQFQQPQGMGQPQGMSQPQGMGRPMPDMGQPQGMSQPQGMGRPPAAGIM